MSPFAWTIDLSVFARERGSFDDRPPGVGNSYCDTIGEGFHALVVSHEDEDDDPVNHAIHSTSHLGLNDWNIDRAVSSKNITVRAVSVRDRGLGNSHCDRTPIRRSAAHHSDIS